MNELTKLAIDAHGGLDRWKRFSTLSVHGINGGLLWGAKGKAGVLADVTITVDPRNEKASHWPFGSEDRRSRFEPQRVALENAKDGKVLAELLQPRTSFQGHALETPWSDLQLAYFAGCAMWTYLNTPFLLVRPGVESEEVAPWQEAGETWRRLKVFVMCQSSSIATSTTEIRKIGSVTEEHLCLELPSLSGARGPAARARPSPNGALRFRGWAARAKTEFAFFT